MQKHPRLFEISAWPWLERLSRAERRTVTLANVPGAHWDRLAQQGFHALFLMGVWRRSAIGRELARTDPALLAEYDRVLPGWTPDDVPGSPYCIQAYEPDARMGGWPGLDETRRQLRQRGIALILDFVPNHTGFDHPWVTAHPERYVLGTEQDVRDAPDDFRLIEREGPATYVACGRDPYFAPWRDVAQLNYFNPETREAMRATLREIAAHSDGVRCDMAMLVLNEVFERTWRRVLREKWAAPADEFWPSATAAVPALTYLAEVYWGLEGTLLAHGFDFAYDKQLLDGLHHSEGAAARARDVLAAPDPDSSRLARFIENHDEPRSAATLGGRLPAAAVVVSTAPGMRFFFDGQFEGCRVKPPVQLGRWPDEPPDEGVRTLYERIHRFAVHKVFHEGDWRMLHLGPAGDDSFGNMVAYRWKSGETLALVVVNLGASASQANIGVAGQLGKGLAFEFDDRLTDARYRWTRDALLRSGLYVRLDPGAAHMFLVREAD